jgi:hypothetical protein
VISVIRDVLAVLGALWVLSMAGLLLLAWLSHRAERRRYRDTRDSRARRPIERVASDPAAWSDFWTDHGLHDIKTPKEWKK